MFVAESLDRQELELVYHIRDNNMGVIIDAYKDIASGWMPGAKRPNYNNALADLEAGRISGIACLAVDRLTRRTDNVRPILNALEAMGGRLRKLSTCMRHQRQGITGQPALCRVC